MASGPPSIPYDRLGLCWSVLGRFSGCLAAAAKCSYKRSLGTAGWGWEVGIWVKFGLNLPEFDYLRAVLSFTSAESDMQTDKHAVMQKQTGEQTGFLSCVQAEADRQACSDADADRHV